MLSRSDDAVTVERIVNDSQPQAVLVPQAFLPVFRVSPAVTFVSRKKNAAKSACARSGWAGEFFTPSQEAVCWRSKIIAPRKESKI